MVTIKGIDPKMIANNLEPSEPTHPGELLKEEIEYRGISQKKLAKEIGISYKVLNDILNCRRPITTNTALLVEAALGIPNPCAHPYRVADGLQYADRQEGQVVHGAACKHKEDCGCALIIPVCGRLKCSRTTDRREPHHKIFTTKKAFPPSEFLPMGQETPG